MKTDRELQHDVIEELEWEPQVIAPLVAFPLVYLLGGYVTLYVVAAVIGLLGAVFVVKIKGVD